MTKSVAKAPSSVQGALGQMSAAAWKHLTKLVEVADTKRRSELLEIILVESSDLLERVDASGGGLSSDQADFLVNAGVFDAAELDATSQRVSAGDLAAKQIRTRLKSVTQSLTTEEVAGRLGIDASTVRHRQGKQLLYSFTVGRNRMYPQWQLAPRAGGRWAPLPGLPRVVEAIPGDMHQATVAGIMTSRQDDLRVDGERVTPAQWLFGGGDPEAVTGVFRSYLQS